MSALPSGVYKRVDLIQTTPQEFIFKDLFFSCRLKTCQLSTSFSSHSLSLFHTLSDSGVPKYRLSCGVYCDAHAIQHENTIYCRNNIKKYFHK